MISPLVVVETTNALQLRRFRRQATTSETSAAIRTFNADIAAGFLSAVAMPTNIWKIGEDLALSHSATLGTRSLDILQVAAALALKCDSFLTFDQNQARLARAAGLLTPIQPE
jgi:predicted nucleic acid-binding protein